MIIRKLRHLGAAVGLAALAGISLPARAIDMLPFDYVPAPAGTTAVLGYYLYGSRDRFDLEGGGKLAGSELDSHIFAARISRWERLGDVPVGVQVILPYAGLRNGRLGGRRLNEPTGMLDPTLTFGFWPIDQPEARRWLAIGNFLTLPLGEYHAGQALNTGENRWRNDIQVDFIQGLPGGFTLDLAADFILYGDNDEAGNGRQTLSQRPTIETFAWLAYNFDPGTWAAVGYYGSFGGRQKLAGVRNGVRTEFHQVRAAFSKFIDSDLQLTGSIGRDIDASGGFRQDYALQFRILKLF